MAEERQEEREGTPEDSTAFGHEDQLAWARDLTNHFVKTLSAYQAQPVDYHSLDALQDQLMEKFRFLLEKVDSLTWDVAEYEIYYKGEILYENTEVKSSLASLLYRDGIEQIRFARGLQEWEVVDFLEVISRAGAFNPMEDDLVTLMSERNFQHIHYVAAGYQSRGSPDEFPENVEDFRKALNVEPMPSYLHMELIREHGLDPGFPHQQLEGDGVRVSAGQLAIQPEEMEALRERMDVETQPEFRFHAVGTLFDVMSLEAEAQGFESVVSFLDRIIASLLGRGDFTRAAQILRNLYIFMNSRQLQEWQSKLVKKVIIEAGESERIEVIGNILKKNEFADIKGALDYFLLLQRNCIPYLCELLGTLTSSKPRRIICDALSKMGRNSIEQMIPFLEDGRWYLVRNIVYILGRIGRKEAVPSIGKALRHEDIRVRREAIQALGLIGGPEAMKHMIRSLEDRDIKIRGIAALNLGRMGEEALDPLMERMGSKEFFKKDAAEIKSYFKAIGMIQSDHAVPLLYSLLERRKWFGRGKADEIRSSAIETLVRIGTQEAREVLQLGTESRDEPLREACRRALRELS